MMSSDFQASFCSQARLFKLRQSLEEMPSNLALAVVDGTGLTGVNGGVESTRLGRGEDEKVINKKEGTNWSLEGA